jgi:hypothetical protein
MTQVLEFCEQILKEGGVLTARSSSPFQLLMFEDATVLGFIIEYDSSAALLENWNRHADTVVGHYQMALRRSALKAWNVSFFFLAAGTADMREQAAFTAIEEDLVGTRKIARAGIQSLADAREALLSLLPIQNAPSIEAVDMSSEIRLRTSELPSMAIDAFVQRADATTVLQLMGSSE